MRYTALFDLFVLVSSCFFLGTFPALLKAQAPSENPPRQKPSLFHVKYVSEGSVYIDAGRNADLQEGMKLSVVNLPPDGVVNDGVRFRGYPHVAELNLVSVADSSAVCDVISANWRIESGRTGFPDAQQRGGSTSG